MFFLNLTWWIINWKKNWFGSSWRSITPYFPYSIPDNFLKNHLFFSFFLIIIIIDPNKLFHKNWKTAIVQQFLVFLVNYASSRLFDLIQIYTLLGYGIYITKKPLLVFSLEGGGGGGGGRRKKISQHLFINVCIMWIWVLQIKDSRAIGSKWVFQITVVKLQQVSSASYLNLIVWNNCIHYTFENSLALS